MSFESPIAARFRGYLPVVIDIETGGFDPARHAVLEFAAVLLEYDGEFLSPGRVLHYQVHPADGTEIDPASVRFHGIDPSDPARKAISERDALRDFFLQVRHAVRKEHCTRATVVAHNAAFDQQFLMAAAGRQAIKRNPFHPFTLIDTATLATVAYGHNVLSRACELAGLEFDARRAHTAIYDADRTAALFCEVVNRWQRFGGWPLSDGNTDQSASQN